MSARNIFFSVFILVIVGFVAYLQSMGKYGLTPPLIIVTIFFFGFINAMITCQSASQKRSDAGLLFTIFISFCFGGIVYFINRKTGTSSVLMAAVYAGCFLLPAVILKNWQLYRMAFQPTAIGLWSLPVPYVKNNAISLHLNSISFTIKVASMPDAAEQDFTVTAPGIKTLGAVFSELVYEQQNSRSSVDFSDITDNPYNWVFYVRELGGLRNRQLDANLSLLDNRLKANATVTVQRQ